MENSIYFFSPSIDPIGSRPLVGKGLDIGNPIEVYKNEEDRESSRFLIKTCVLARFIFQILEEKKSITLMELGCGNGSNSRFILRMIQESKYRSLPVKVIFVDVSSILLQECGERCKRSRHEYQNFSYELVQLDARNQNDLVTFSEKYESCADLVFSIKFLHNVSIKTDRAMAKCISSILAPKGVFLSQFYGCRGLRRGIVNHLKFALRIGYNNSVLIDRVVAIFWLWIFGLSRAYNVTSRNMSRTSMSHFLDYSIETYFQKRGNVKL